MTSLKENLHALLRPEEEETRRPLSAIASACTAKEPRFAEAYVELGGSFGAGSEAARAAGYGNASSSAKSFASIADRELNKDQVIAYIAELSKKKIRSLVPAAVNAVREIIDDPSHKDRLKASMAAIERIGPVVSKQEIKVEHVVNHDADAVDVLRHYKAIGASREMLEAHFGFSGLGHYERLLAAQDLAKGGTVIEGEVIDEHSIEFWRGE